MDEEMLDLSLAVGRSKMVVIAFWLFCRDLSECIPCLLGSIENPMVRIAWLPTVSYANETKPDTNKDRLKALYFRREGDRFSWYEERGINGVSQLNQPI